MSDDRSAGGPALRDGQSVLASIRRRARAYSGLSGPLPRPAGRPPLAHDPSLGYLHAHWVLPDRPSAPGRRGWRTYVHAAAGRVVFSSLHRYLAEERELLSRLVQVTDLLARRLDALESDLRDVSDSASSQLAALSAYLPATAHGQAEGPRLPESEDEPRP